MGARLRSFDTDRKPSKAHIVKASEMLLGRVLALFAVLALLRTTLGFRAGTNFRRARGCVSRWAVEPEDKIPDKFITASDSARPQGYLSSDLNKLEDGKQNRVLAYIGLALVPCLFLVPFFLSRDFVPPTID